MDTSYQHLGNYSGIVAKAMQQTRLYPLALPGPETQQKVREVIGWCNIPENPAGIRIEQTWERDGLAGEVLSWDTGYGPRTQAWLIKPAGVTRPLPAILALHDHGGFKYFGKEKIAEGPEPPLPFLENYRQKYYGGRAWVNALARSGFVVLVHDTFLWGSRKFPAAEMKAALRTEAPKEVLEGESASLGTPSEVAEYNYLAGLHEHLIAKYLNLLGTSLAGVVAHEDRIALNVLRSRNEVQPENIACMGLSGGGNRAGLLRATAEGLKAAVVVGLMSTYAGLLDHNVHHTWMFYPYLWARFGDWPDLVACQAPARLLVQYDMDDELFTPEGMQDAHKRLSLLYRSAGDEGAYTGQFYPGPHKFDCQMQDAAVKWLKEVLS